MTATVPAPTAVPGGPAAAGPSPSSPAPGGGPRRGPVPVATGRRLPPLGRVVSGRVFYGWYVSLACTAMMFVTVGVSYYGLSLFLKPLQEEHHWSTGLVTGATGTFFVISGLASFAAGPWIDRVGPRLFLGLGIVLTAVGAAGVGFVHSIWQLYATYSLLAIAYGMGAVVPVSTLMSRWFIHNRAKAMMVSSTGVSLGGAILVPIGAVLISKGGLELAAPVLGVVVLAVALPVLLLVVSPSPADMGLEPDGGGPPPTSTRIDRAAQYRVWTRAETLRSLPFWAIIVAFFLCLAAQTGVLINQIAFLQQPGKLGSRGAAALAVTTTTIGSIIARMIVSMFADRLDKRFMAAVLFVLQAVAITGYLLAHSTASIYAVALLMGFTIGNVYMAQSLLVGELYGLMSFGSVYGMVSLVGQVGSGISLIGMGILIQASHGSFTRAFLLLAVFDLVAAVVVLGAVAPAPASEAVPGRVPGAGSPADGSTNRRPPSLVGTLAPPAWSRDRALALARATGAGWAPGLPSYPAQPVAEPVAQPGAQRGSQRP